VTFVRAKKNLIAMVLHMKEGLDVTLRDAKELCAKRMIIVATKFAIYFARILQLLNVTSVRVMKIFSCVEPSPVLLGVYQSSTYCVMHFM